MRNGKKVFVAGSRRLSRLNKDVMRRIDSIVDKGFTIIVGDANGVDRAVQHYLKDIGYGNVLVFCMEGGCRNNIGDWPTRKITATVPGRRDFAYYATKDRAMAQEADYGLMLWDGRSRGTLTNVVHLVRQGKPVLIYIAPDKSFHTLRQSSHLAELLDRVDPDVVHRIDSDLQTVAASTSSSSDVDPEPMLWSS
jgi:hypothetical protein